MQYLNEFLWQYRGKTALTLLLLLGQSVGTLLIPFLIAGIVDQGILAGNLEVILRIGGWMLLVSLLGAAVSVWGSWCSADLAARFGHAMREKLFQKSQQLSLRQFDAIGVSSMVTRATSDIAALQANLGIFLQLVAPAPILAAASIAMTVAASPQLALVLVVCVVVFLVFAWSMFRRSGPLSGQIQTRLDHINQVVREVVTGTRVIRAFGNETYEQKRCDGAFEGYAQNMVRMNRLFAVLNPAVWVLLGGCMAAILWLGGTLAGYGVLEVGQITAVSEYAVLTLSYLIMAAACSVMLPKVRACLDRLKEVLDLHPEISDCDGCCPQPRPDAPAVEFDQVTFSYPGAEEPVLCEVSFQCRAGETTAVIGGTGAGKSTLANLLLRLHDVQGGAVRLEGVDVRDQPQDALCRAVGFVPQQSFLFSGTIAENLRQGNREAGEQVLWKALQVAQADSFVAQLPLGLESPVAQGGTNFSGGQRQRLAIARALVKQAQVYVFDDSFSALDTRTDAALRRALKDYGPGAAKLIIAQRVSTILNADQILVLDQGRLVGRGTHRELMECCEVYQDIVKSQMERKGA